MVWYIVSVVASMVFDILRLAKMSTDEKDLETLLLRQQLMIVQRK